MTIDDKTQIKYFKVSKHGEEYIPLPERLIAGARSKKKKLFNLDPTRTLSNNKDEQEEVNICATCIDTEACEIYMITRSTKRLTEENETKEKGRKDENHVDIKLLRPILKSKMDINKDISKKENKVTRENVHCKAMRRSVKRNLLEPDYDYLLSNDGMIIEESGSLMHKTLRLDAILGIKKGPTTLEEGRMESRRKMLITSQKEITPSEQKPSNMLTSKE